jgi:membrane protein DedA with SNARE-associated domain/rhodanese-related sulfurtransferase
LTQTLLALIERYGLLAVTLNVLLNQIGFPLPVTPTLIVAGAIAAGGNLSAAELFMLSLLACLIADSAWYFVGQTYGIRVLRTLCRISLEPDSCVNRTQMRFERWGTGSLIFAKFVPGLSIITPPLAGALRIGWGKFLCFSSLGAALWILVGLGIGMLFRAQIEYALGRMEDVGQDAAVLIVGIFAAYIAYKWWERRRFYAMLRMARIDVAELYELMNAGAAPVIIDVRSATARALEPRGIPGALHVPLGEVAQHVKLLPRDRDIILYCTCPSEASAARVAKILMNHGFKRVRPLLGGLDAWIAAGYSVEGQA